MSRFRVLAALPLMAALSGCNMVVLNPSGDVAQQQANLVVISTVLMLLIIVPVMALTVLFAWRYRKSNSTARYEPDWDHSTQLELVIWAAPLLIIICLGAITWITTHLLDPYRPLDRIAADRPIPPGTRTLEVDVVAMDWKWLFLYPEQGIALVNEMAAPVDRPIRFNITASSVMNSFYVPALAGQVYAMPGMQTQLHAVINKPGSYRGFSANYSGAGFSQMRFTFHGLSEGDFDRWVADVKASGGKLDRSGYQQLAKPSVDEPVRRYGAVEDGLFKAVVGMCVEPGKMCMHDMMAIDARGGLGMAGINSVMPRQDDGQARRASAVFGPAPSYVAAGICSVAELGDAAVADAVGGAASFLGADRPRSSLTPTEASAAPSPAGAALRPSTL
ncbi:ubiquinol oxidase subunit II [Azospirillum thermophilum]|uniref:Ubiquinol oxidase polypeptide II n=1 Tax=Azospirillum thermophilum TaxID=2202148 RepID=A0A2S2CY43_9PROT|nr:ubiquinol oxidase subunit II [Azospirillum thermophilum]AWK89330.1 ubiquinol oxidase subunit II [Azospirillum thermophilum]